MTDQRVYVIRHGALFLSALRRTRWVTSDELARRFHTHNAAVRFLVALSADENRAEYEYVIESFYPPSREVL